MTLRIASLALVAFVAMIPTQKAKSGQLVASWYGSELAGNPTACSGTPYDPNSFTAASKTLPCGTRLHVCKSGCVDVRIDDKGPFVPGRDLDLSEASAKAIGLDSVGTVEVKDESAPITTLPNTGGLGQ